MKKFFKWIAILLLTFVALLLLLFLVFTIKNRRFLESADSEFVEYLNRHKTVLTADAFEPSAPLFAPELYQSKVIFLGEIHGLAAVQSIDKALLLHLHRKIGLRYYLAEMDSLRAKQLNTFLMGETKDSVLLKRTVVEIKQRIPQQSSLELFQKWSDLYDYNQTLPDSLKIVVVGVDTDFGVKSSISRDQAMMQNFSAFVQRHGLEEEPFYGLFGVFHTLQNGVNKENLQPFASLLHSAGVKVSSIVCFNVESEMYLPKNDEIPTPPSEKIGFLNQDGPLMLVKGINDLKKASEKADETLFCLVGEHSPYTHSQKLIRSKTNFFNQEFYPYNEELSTVDFAQYAILLRNSEALSPIN